MRDKIVCSALLTLCVSLLAGCSGGTGHGGAGSPSRSSPSSSSPAEAARQGRTLPIEAYLLTTEQAQALDRADDILTARCMARAGFQAPPTGLPPTDDNQFYRRYGVVDRTVAERYGYHPEPGSPILVALSRQSGVGKQRQLSDAEKVALYGGAALPAPGTPPAGCLGEVAHELKQQQGADLTDVVSVINFRAYDKSRNDPVVRAATRAWSACMASKGFSYADPLAAIRDNRWASPQPSKAELSSAVGDVDCKGRTDLVNIWFAADSRLEQADIQKHVEQLTTLRKEMDDQIAAVSAVLKAK